MKLINILTLLFITLFLAGCSEASAQDTELNQVDEITTIDENTQAVKLEVNEETKIESETEVSEEIITPPQGIAIGEPHGAPVREFTLDAFSYGYSETEIKVRKGETVKITLTNSNGFHNFVIDELDVVSKKIKEGDVTTFEFTAGEVGNFEFYCSIGNHRAQGMIGTLIIEEY